MSKIIIVLVAIAAIGGSAFFWTHKSVSGPNTSEATATTSAIQSSEAFAAKSSLKDLVARGGSWKCTFAIDVAGTNSTGTVYVANGKVRSDFNSMVKQVKMTVASHMISDGAYAYSWTNLMPQGYKIPIKPTSTATSPVAASGSQGFDYNSALDYNCAAWPTDESMFTLPSNITFTTVKG